MVYGYCNTCFSQYVVNGNGQVLPLQCGYCGIIGSVIYAPQEPFYGVCQKCKVTHKTYQLMNGARNCPNCRNIGCVQFTKEKPFSAYCTGCYGQFKNLGPCTPIDCPKCQRKGLAFKQQDPYVAYCSQCFTQHKTHEKVHTFAKCTKCGQFNGLKFKDSKQVPARATCKKRYMNFKAFSFKATFDKCPNCGQWDGLKFKN